MNGFSSEMHHRPGINCKKWQPALFTWNTDVQGDKNDDEVSEAELPGGLALKSK